MSRWYDVRCERPPRGYTPYGHCHRLLLRVNTFGDVEVKCSGCNQVQVIGRETLDRYRELEYATT